MMRIKSKEILAFIVANFPFWLPSNGSQRQQREHRWFTSRDYVLSPIVGKPVMRICDASFSSIVAKARGLRQLFLVSDMHDPLWTPILKSYPQVTLRKLPNRNSILRQLAACVRATIAYVRLRTVEDLLAFQQDGIRFGDVLYDEVLTGGYATVSGIDRRSWTILRRFYVLRGFVLRLLRQYRMRSAVLNQYVGLTMATLTRYLLTNGVEVFLRGGSHELLLRRYRTVQDLHTYPLRPDPQLFTKILDGDDGTIRAKAEEHLDRRFNQKIDHPTLAMAFDPKKKTYTTPEEFCTAYELDGGLPIVFVMLHAFNDYPHSHFGKPMVFQDYYWWFRNTLSIAERNTKVHWVFKEHPSNWRYVTRDLNLHQMFADIHRRNIRLLPYDADFNAKSIIHIAHAVVTCVGTAGLEYSAHGIPCVLAGESGYDGFGFTHEPQTQEEFRKVLLSIEKLQRLTPEQVVRAKLVAYFFLCVIETSRYHFCPIFTDREVMEWTEKSDSRFWKEASEAFTNPAPVAQMREQVHDLSGFILDGSRTQYYDLRQFPFLADTEEMKP